MNRPRSALLLAALTGLVASLLVLFAATPEADACSIAPPQLEVWPRTDLQPGDPLKVRGSGFHDAVWHDIRRADSATVAAAPERVAPAIAQSIEPNTCAGLELVPQVVVLSWIGLDEQPLQRVMGPDFELELRVPDWASPGWAALSANGVLAELKIGDGVPEPCPLAGSDADLARWPDHCPEPCPELFDAAGRVAYPPCPDPCDLIVRPATGAADAARWCPEPCPVYAHGDVAAQVLPPRCPDPCAAGSANAAVWCPPPPCPAVAEVDPNRVGEDEWRQRWPHCPWPCDTVAEGALSIWPCPRPCPAVGDVDPSQVTEDEWKRRLPHCPWPCDLGVDVVPSYWPCPRPCPTIGHLDGTDAVFDAEAWRTRWPDCPWPCPLPIDTNVGDELRVWPCPPPCPVHAHGDAVRADAEVLSYWCPDPCGWLADGVLAAPDAEALSYWCPDPCRGIPVDPATGSAADRELPDDDPVWCPYPLPVPEPVPCVVDPDGTTWCEDGPVGPAVTPATEAVTSTAVPSEAALGAATPTTEPGVDDSPPSWSPVRPAAAPDDLAPAPRIDFDGCRADGPNGPSPCLDVAYDRAVQSLRRLLTGLGGR